MRAIFLAIGFVLLAVQPSFAADFHSSGGAAGVHGFMSSVRGNAPWLRRAMHDIGRNPTGWSHEWCARQMNMWLRETGRQGSGSNAAISFARYGKGLPGPRVGAIAVLPHHVGIVKSYNASTVTLVSGNHGGRSGHRTVGIGHYPRSRIVAYRWP